MNQLISYAQNREDIIIDAFFDYKDNGFYLDVGANYPVEASVTKRFYQRGWHGINFEPNVKLHGLLKADRPRDTNLCIGVGAVNSESSFRQYDNADGLSTFSEAEKQTLDPSYVDLKKDYVDIQVPVRTLASIAKEYLEGVHVDFLKVDVEGFEYDVLAGNDWNTLKPEVICIEANHVDQDWHPLLDSHGYSIFFNDGLNEYYALSDSPRLKAFKFPEKVLMKGSVVPFQSHSELSGVNIEQLINDESWIPVEPHVGHKKRAIFHAYALRSAVEDIFVESIMLSRRAKLQQNLMAAVSSPSTLKPIALTERLKTVAQPNSARIFVKRVVLRVLYLFNELTMAIVVYAKKS